ncbi:RNA polymerase subunit sigma-70 [Pseudonocardia sp. WMMC193]|uniref:RNA polymerase subunit sigma-70 n=1 Tax=Pseudonocardia sp. WMMC193 TaxID=2911965 RepID=UPI001F02E1AE|nr:RNA polymerase subunit sigma-70 [Pseudonocardia sp. WMMC193]MCF7552275.1 RNA polymerase subunit sigma-70 [Pseudonocardia sp. WMMC193]
MTDARLHGADEAAFIAAARADDTARFALQTEPHRRALQVHCYRMLANYEDAQDLTQETFLRAWNKRETFDGRATLRTWLYRIATNACLDFLDKRTHRTPLPVDLPGAGSEVRYLQPYPDRLLPDDPHETAVARETIELAFVVAVQHLPPRQRAALILRDVLGWPAAATADALGLSVASVTSALQRARETMRAQLPDRRLDWRTAATRGLSADERATVKAWVDAHERNDLDGLLSLMREDLRFTMPPDPGVLVTARSALDSWVTGGFGGPGYDDWRCVVTTVNRMPAVVEYLRTPEDPVYRLFAIDVLHIVDGRIAELTGFPAADKPWLGLPATL